MEKEILITIKETKDKTGECFVIRNKKDFKNCLRWLDVKYWYITEYPDDWKELERK